MKNKLLPGFVALIGASLFGGASASAQTNYQWSHAFVPPPGSDPLTGNSNLNSSVWAVHRTAGDAAYQIGYHGLRSEGDTIALGVSMGQVSDPSRVTIINKSGAPALGIGDSINFQFAWRPAGGTFDTEAIGNPQNQIMQFGLLRDPYLTLGANGDRGGLVGPVGSWGGEGYSFLGDGFTDAFYFGATQVGSGQNDLSLAQGDATFSSGLTVNFGVYDEHGTQLIDFGNQTLGIKASMMGSDSVADAYVYSVYLFNLTFSFVSESAISVSASFEQVIAPSSSSRPEYPDTYTGYTVNLGNYTTNSGLNGYDNLYVGMGHNIADQNQVALSGSSYDGLATRYFTEAPVPEPGSALLTALTGGLLLGLRRRR